MKEPIISICRQSKSWAVFDGFTCVKAFERYDIEQSAIDEGKAFCTESTEIEPHIVYPRITKMTVTNP